LSGGWCARKSEYAATIDATTLTMLSSASEKIAADSVR
jgi:hypothetical protein